MTGRIARGALCLAILAAPPGAGAIETTLVAAGSTWRYLDDGSDQGTAWRAAAFDDSGWAEGAAELGYGDSDEATVVSYGGNASAKHTTTYFRIEFEAAGVAGFTRADLALLRDDGAAVYLNGVEVYRSNLPGGAIASSTFASSAIGNPEESTFSSTRPSSIPRSWSRERTCSRSRSTRRT